MVEWRHNICERDWFVSPRFSAHTSGGFRMPNRVVLAVDAGDLNDICCVCGVPTVSGIYVRADENTLLCKGDHEHPDKWSPLLGKPVAREPWVPPADIDPAIRTTFFGPARDDDYTPEAMDRTDR